MATETDGSLLPRRRLRRRAAPRRARLQAGPQPRVERRSRTSRSRSRSSRSSPGCFTTYGRRGTTAARSRSRWGWPIICGLILIIAFCMSELVSRVPDRGRHLLVGVEARRQGLGLVHRLVQPHRPRRRHRVGRLRLGDVRERAARRSTASTSASSTSATTSTSCARRSCSSSLFLAIHALVNIYSSPLRRADQQHLRRLARARRRGDHRDPHLRPRRPRERGLRLHRAHQQLGLSTARSAACFWFYVLPLGFLLTMYTQTGYDASAHVSEETQGAALGAAQGRVAVGLLGRRSSAGSCCWRSRSRPPTSTRSTRPAGVARSSHLRRSRSTRWAAEARCSSSATIGQLFCGIACLTSALAHVLRVLARPRGPRAGGSGRASTTTACRRSPCSSWRFCGAASSRSPRWSATRTTAPVAFFAVVSIAVIGLYIAYVIPIYLRWRKGDAFEPGPWTLGKQVQVDEPGRGRLGRDHRDHLHPADRRRPACRGTTSSTGSPSTTRRSPSASCFAAVGLWWLRQRAEHVHRARSATSTMARRAGSTRRRARPAARRQS